MNYAISRVRGRGGFTMVECTVTLAVIAILGLIVAEALVLSTRERARTASHQAALELAANVLEEARAQPWDQLNQAWADGGSVPSEMSDLLMDGKILVKVESGQPLPQTRRVSVEIRWKSEHDAMVQRVELHTILSPRSAKKNGGTP